MTSGDVVRQGYRFTVRKLEYGGRDAVVKSTRPGPLPARSSAPLLRHEYELLRRLDLRGVSRPISLETSQDGTLQMFVEDAGPRNLADLLGGQPLEVDPFLNLAIAMAEVVDAVHRKNVIHRDICPENFVVGSDGTSVVLVDFASATTVASFTECDVAPTELTGTLAYIAPEATGRMKRRVDARADLYSLGATFYEMLTGAPPFPASDPLETIHDHLARMPFSPTAVDPAVPVTLSQIVLRLLAKMPEHRYQSAEALLFDLREARRRWRASGLIAPFEVGQKDVPYGLFGEARLFGRHEEHQELLQAFERSVRGTREVITVVGKAGVGKSALIDEFRRATEGRCHFIAGKCDRLRENQPYAPFVEALADFVDRLLEGPAEVVDALRRRIEEAVAPNARVLVDAIPALGQLLGAQSPVSEVGPLEAENRFRYAFGSFVRALSAGGIPVTVALDDLQWADPASLNLLTALARDPDLHSTLLVAAYRSEDGPAHPPERMPALAGDTGTPGLRLELQPLDATALVELLADVLAVDRSTAKPLAEIVRRKTDGNPFFVRRLLAHLYREGLIVRDTQAGSWRWDLARIAAAEATDNVGALLSTSLSKLSVRDRTALTTAACIGHSFDLALLATVCDAPRDDVAAALWAPLEEGLLVPAERIRSPVGAGQMPVELGATAAPCYRFAHDRIQQAAYDSLEDQTRRALHLRIGRELLRAAGETEADAHIGEIVDQLNRAEIPAAERTWLAGLNLRAGRRAAAQSAPAAALAYLERGLAFLPEAPWAAAHTLWFVLTRGAAEVAASVGEYERCDRLVAEGLRHAETLAEKAAFYLVNVVARTKRNETLPGALAAGIEGLRVLGIDVASGDVPLTAQNEMQWCSAILSQGPPLEAAPTGSVSELDQLRLSILKASLLPAWFIDVDIFKILACAALRLVRQIGPNREAAGVYASVALCFSLDQRYKEAFELGIRARALLERFPNATDETTIRLMLATDLRPFHAPVAESIPLLRHDFRRALQVGDIFYAGVNAIHVAQRLLFSGAPLNDVLGEVDSVLSFCRQRGLALLTLSPLAVRQAARCLKGSTYGTASFDDADFDETRFLAEASESKVARAWFYTLRLQVAYLFDHLPEAQGFARCCAGLASHLRVLFREVDYFFYAALVTAARLQGTPPEERPGMLDEIREHLRRLQYWAERCPSDYRQKYLLVAAELARVEGRVDEALTLFVDAIEAGHVSGFQHDTALAHERCGRFLLSRNAHDVAALHFQSALDGYELWGASAKVTLLQRELATLGLKRTRAPSPVAGAPELDFMSLFKAAETLTGELVLDRLLPKLTRACAEAASAQRAALILDDDGLFVRATLSATGEVTLERTPLAASRTVPVSVIESAFHSGARVLLDDAVNQGPFATDPYVAEQGVRSLLALPIRRAERAIGVFYFENNLATHAFASERVRLLDVLSAEIAISLENSRLFEERRRDEAEARFIAEASKTLAESLDYEATLTRVARLAVPVLADGCIVDVVEGNRLRRIAGAHVDPARELLLRELADRPPVAGDAPHPAELAVSTGNTYCLNDVTDTLVATHILDARRLQIVRGLGFRSLLAAPMVAHGRTIGAITLICTQAGRYRPREVGLAEEVARRAAVAIESGRLYREAQDSVRVRDEFLAAAAHELRTPLTSLVLSVQGLLASSNTPPERVKRVAQLTNQQAGRLAKLVDDMMTVGRIHLRRLDLVLGDVDLVAVARRATEALAGSFAKARCTVEFCAPRPVRGRWDGEKLGRVVTNLLLNAVKFGAGKPIEIAIDEESGIARLVVTDHGIGIDSKTLPRVFEEYERAPVAHMYGGLGIGLYIARAVVEALGGTIGAESIEGRETRFTVHLPLEGPVESYVAQRPHAGPHAGP